MRSGTSGEAIMLLNRERSREPEIILIEEGEGEDKFCRSLTAKRLKLAIQTSAVPIN